jgi:acid phosphatase family membrane protein YuiD
MGYLMNWLIDLITNPFLITSTFSWFIAQVLKTLLTGFLNKKWTFERMVGDGGMPSGHSATVASLSVACALYFGCASFEFAFSTLFALVVCRDAMGIRREAGVQATVLNDLIKHIKNDGINDVTLKEFLGHTPMQVLAGIIIGVLNALLMGYFLL